MSHVRALFILKQREDYSTDIKNFNLPTVATGMYNSAKFVSDMLEQLGYESKVVTVVDNNKIDAEVKNFRATHVFIEGYWVVPSKFDELMPLHPKVNWIVRCHSELPFLAQEGIGIGWTLGYLRRGIRVAGNNPRINREIRVIAHAAYGWEHRKIEDMIPLLPNFYPVAHGHHSAEDLRVPGEIHVGCFGAFRPLKNHLVQMIAAIDYAERNDLKLRFHVNSGRVELNGGAALKNARDLFLCVGPKHQLIEHGWTSHSRFVQTIKKMDMCLQVSFSETFNIVTADAVNVGVPVVVSSEIDWVKEPHADPTSTVDIVEKMEYVWENREDLVVENKKSLHRFSHRSSEKWASFLSGSHVLGFGRALMLEIGEIFK